MTPAIIIIFFFFFFFFFARQCTGENLHVKMYQIVRHDISPFFRILCIVYSRLVRVIFAQTFRNECWQVIRIFHEHQRILKQLNICFMLRILPREVCFAILV